MKILTFRIVVALAATGSLLVLSCKSDGEDARECNVHADCASGVCLPHGECEPYTPPVDAANDSAPDTGLDTGLPDVDQDTGPDVEPGTCQPNHDGIITAEELPLEPGFQAMFRVSTDVNPYVSAPDCASGTCVWDLVDVGGTTSEEPGGTLALQDQWFADMPEFASATYVAKVTEFKLAFVGVTVCDQVQLGVFQLTDQALVLLGLVSERQDGGTKLIYDPPVRILQLPLQKGESWRTETVASGPLCNSMFDYHISQTYDSVVDEIGEVRTPYGNFTEVLRVNTDVQRHLGVGVTPSRLRSHTFVAECFTTIGAVSSLEGVTDPEFNQASEVRRLSNL